MRIICDVCESAPAVLFCAADEAALCRPCDDKVHKCNKLASRHVRVVLADPSEVSRCDICEVSPAFFYCEIDGSSLCLQCDTIVHVGGKRTHSRYLLLRQRVENNYQPDNHMDHDHSPKPMVIERQQNHEVSPPSLVANNDDNSNTGSIMIDLNKRPSRNRGQASSKQGTWLVVKHTKTHQGKALKRGAVVHDEGRGRCWQTSTCSCGLHRHRRT